MERLTEKSKGINTSYTLKDTSCTGCMNAVDKLGKYEDLEDQGLLLKTSCKTGDIIYYPEKDFNFIFPVKISQVIISDLGDGRVCTQYNGCFFNGDGDPVQEFEFEDGDFGKNVFLTQSEAEQVLKKKEERYTGNEKQKSLREMLAGMEAEDREFLYDCLRQTKIAADIKEFVLENEEYSNCIDEDDLESFANDVAEDYDGPDYDANKSHWDNIETIVKKALGKL